MKYWYFFLVLITSLTACQETTENEPENIEDKPTPEAPVKQPEQTEPATDISQKNYTIADVAGVYVGQLPCADCEKMDYRIELTPDGGYTERIYYIGKSKEPHETIGKFTITAENKIDLGKYNPGMNYLGITETGLLMLDIDGNVISGPLASKYVLSPFAEQTSMQSDIPINTRMWNTGVEFYASGNEPNWSLTLDLEKEIVFKVGDETIVVPPSAPEMAQDADILRFRSVTERVELILSIASDPMCNDQMSSQAYDASVRVELKRSGESDYSSWTGCGRYSIHPELFETSWKLISLNDIPTEDSKYQRGAPELTFRAFDRGFGGHDGCNEVGGRISIRADKFSFSSFASTALSCPNMTASREFNIAVQGETFSYVIFDELLTLTQFKNKLVFAKVQN
jgi:uncharacterized membrane protein/heat shock protein HslJ